MICNVYKYNLLFMLFYLTYLMSENYFNKENTNLDVKTNIDER